MRPWEQAPSCEVIPVAPPEEPPNRLSQTSLKADNMKITTLGVSPSLTVAARGAAPATPVMQFPRLPSISAWEWNMKGPLVRECHFICRPKVERFPPPAAASGSRGNYGERIACSITPANVSRERERKRPPREHTGSYTAPRVTSLGGEPNVTLKAGIELRGMSKQDTTKIVRPHDSDKSFGAPLPAVLFTGGKFPPPTERVSGSPHPRDEQSKAAVEETRGKFDGGKIPPGKEKRPEAECREICRSRADLAARTRTCIQLISFINNPKAAVHYQQCSDPSRASCPFCKNRYLKKELGGHIRDGCPSRIVQCRHCRVDMEDHLRQKHEKTCDMRPATCEYCKANLKTFAELRDHHLDRCLQRTRKCVFADFGCPFQGIWQQIEQHMAVSNNHTDVLVKRVIELTRDVQELQRQLGVQSLATTTMDEKFSRQLNEVEGKLECVTNNMAIHSADLQAQKQVQSTQKNVFERLFEEGEKANQSFRAEVLEKFSEVPTEFTHVWKIQPYTHLRDATAVSSTKRLSSGKIYTGTPGYCIEFLVDLNGAVAGSTATHVGAMFKIHSGEYDNLMPWPFYSREADDSLSELCVHQLQIVLTLKNHLYPDKSVQFQIIPRDSSPELLECFARPQPGLSSKVFGISKVISTPLLENESKGFLLGNCIVLTFAIYPDLDL
ncbi:hypothetical protein HPB47_015819 [Ixodes persulcatus]|uniref:Uncharacterized protein n=1 Tax=Ixodes persulcatus TaxID=34615 RepID=A0AC60QSK1_IXOPE|nr:hypothetical protein HPB47_015819 [Ixodes persulcatus]